MSTEDDLRRLGQTAAALMGVAAARAKQVAEELLGSGDKAREETKHHAGTFFEGGRYAAADVVSALRREAAVVLRDLEHLEENLRYRQTGGASPSTATSGETEDEAPEGPEHNNARLSGRGGWWFSGWCTGDQGHDGYAENRCRQKGHRPPKSNRDAESNRHAANRATALAPRAGGSPELGARRRLDAELVNRGLAGDRAEASSLVAAGRVLVAGAVASKSSRQVAPSEPIVVSGLPPRFASRGGEKLDAALEHFCLDVVGKDALDAGASTGGFTDCLLQRGVAKVVAVDVGHGQLLSRLRADPRVEVMEHANVRYLQPRDVGNRCFDMVVADLSFISLMMVAQALLGLAKPRADLVVLVKPQFEAGHAVVSKGKGVVRDPKVWASVLCDVAGAFQAWGAIVAGGMASPLLGAAGNVEFFLHLRTGGRGPSLVGDSLSSIALSAAPATASREGGRPAEGSRRTGGDGLT